MGRGRSGVAFVVVAALAIAGCGAESHPNEPRPQSPTRISVTLNDSGVVVTPIRVAFGPEPSQQIPQNQNHAQPPIKTKKPLQVVFVIANQTDHPTWLQVHGRPKDIASPTIPPNSPATYPAELPTGSYYVTADKVSTDNEPILHIGPVRTSSENDVLLP